MGLLSNGPSTTAILHIITSLSLLLLPQSLTSKIVLSVLLIGATAIDPSNCTPDSGALICSSWMSIAEELEEVAVAGPSVSLILLLLSLCPPALVGTGEIERGGEQERSLRSLFSGEQP